MGFLVNTTQCWVRLCSRMLSHRTQPSHIFERSKWLSRGSIVNKSSLRCLACSYCTYIVSRTFVFLLSRGCYCWIRWPHSTGKLLMPLLPPGLWLLCLCPDSQYKNWYETSLMLTENTWVEDKNIWGLGIMFCYCDPPKMLLYLVVWMSIHKAVECGVLWHTRD